VSEVQNHAFTKFFEIIQSTCIRINYEIFPRDHIHIGGGYDSAVEKESADGVSIVEKSIDANEFRSPLHCGNMFSIQCPFEKRENE